MQDQEDDPQDLQLDWALFTLLQDSKFTGPPWNGVADRMARYGCGLMEAWIHTKVIFKRCEEKGYYTPKRRIHSRRRRSATSPCTRWLRGINKFRKAVDGRAGIRTVDAL